MDDEVEQPEPEAKAEPVPNAEIVPPIAEAPVVETPVPTVEQLLAKQRAEFEAEKATAIEVARKEAADQALADERKRLAEEARLAAMTEAERLAAEKNAAEDRAKTADAARVKAEASAQLERQRAEFARALSDSEFRLVRDKDGGGADLDAERIAFEFATQLAGTGVPLPQALADARAAKPWIFESRVAAEPSNTNTGGGPAPAGRRQAPKTPAEKSPNTMAPGEWAQAQRKLGMVR